jgi:hypothetical protein
MGNKGAFARFPLLVKIKKLNIRIKYSGTKSGTEKKNILQDFQVLRIESIAY